MTSVSANLAHPVDAALHCQVARLLMSCAQCIDDDQLEQWPDYFIDDCHYRVQSRENYDRGLPVSAMSCHSKGMLIDRVVSLRHANIYAEHFYRHILSIPVIHSATDNEIVVHTNYVVFQTLLDGASHTYSVGRYLDKIVVLDGALKFKERIVVFDTNQIATLMVTPI